MKHLFLACSVTIYIYFIFLCERYNLFVSIDRIDTILSLLMQDQTSLAAEA